jgi:hypothetical protein
VGIFNIIQDLHRRIPPQLLPPVRFWLNRQREIFNFKTLFRPYHREKTNTFFSWRMKTKTFFSWRMKTKLKSHSCFLKCMVDNSKESFGR